MTSNGRSTTQIVTAAACFDGHTEFVSLTFTQKLVWLSEAAASVYILAQCNPDAGCNSLFDAEPSDGRTPA